MSFYITLLNNSSNNIYPNNTMTSFRTQLSDQYTFNRPYEVGLVEFTYMHDILVDLGSILIILSKEHTILVKIKYVDGDDIEQLLVKIKESIELELLIKLYNEEVQNINRVPNVQVQVNDYVIGGSNVESIITNARANLYFNQLPTFHFEKNRVKLRTPPQKFVLFSGKICNILNIENGKQYGSEGITEYSFNTIISKNPSLVPLLFIYTDIIEYQYVGETTSPLLRINTVLGKAHENSWSHYDNPHYCKCNSNSISSIHIYLKDHLGNDIQFLTNGVVSVKLHFRPIQ